MRRRGVAPLVLLLLASVPLSSQRARPSIPTFKAAARLVQFTVVVDGPQGPVSGLTRDDFVITANGKRQPVTLFQANGAVARGVADALTPLRRGEYSNRPAAAGRDTPNVAVILLDCMGATQPMGLGLNRTWDTAHACQYAQHHLEQFVTQVGPNDLVAIFALNRRLRLLSGFSSDPHQLLAALQAYKTTEIPALAASDGQPELAAVNGDFATLVAAADASFGGYTAMNRRATGMAALRAIANYVAQVPGHISLIWLTATPMVSGADVAAALGNQRIAVYPVDARGLVTSGAHSAAGPAIAGSLPGAGIMLEIAAATGGFAYMNRNDLETGVRAALDDSAEGYTLGYYVGDQALDNQYHQLRVRVSVSGLHARYPHGYWALADTSVPSGVDPLAVAIASPADAEAIPIQAQLIAAGSGAWTIRGSVCVAAADLRRDGDLYFDTLVLGVVGQNAAGTILLHQTKSVTLRLGRKEYAATLRNGVPFDLKLRPPPGTASLRFVAEDVANGQVGSLIIPLTGPVH